MFCFPASYCKIIVGARRILVFNTLSICAILYVLLVLKIRFFQWRLLRSAYDHIFLKINPHKAQLLNGLPRTILYS
jgi:hypothetical protein